MSEWLLSKGRSESDPVSLARDAETLHYELEGRAFAFECRIVPNPLAGKGIAVMMQLTELPASTNATGRPNDAASQSPIVVRDLAATFDEDSLPRETDLSTIVRSRNRARWLFASAADLVNSSAS
jgi:hypothetical protein